MVENRGYVFADHLKSILLTIEAKGYKIVGHSWGRTPAEQVRAYEENKQATYKLQCERDDIEYKPEKCPPLLASEVAWDSKHLPCFITTKLRAHDFHVEKDGVRLSWAELYDLVTKTGKELLINNYGLIISKIGNWCHLDEREIYYFGYYDY